MSTISVGRGDEYHGASDGEQAIEDALSEGREHAIDIPDGARVSVIDEYAQPTFILADRTTLTGEINTTVYCKRPSPKGEGFPTNAAP